MKQFSTLVVLLFIAVCTQAQTPQHAEGFHSEPATNKSQDGDWIQPVGAAFSRQGNMLFVWEKRGRVYLSRRNESIQSKYQRQETPIINIGPEVGDWEDYGLLGFALDPDFSESSGGYIYLLYCVDLHHLRTGGVVGVNGYSESINEYGKATIGRITRYNTQVVGGQLLADMGSREILLGNLATNGIPLLHNSHSVGSLAFAADRTLIVSTGDGASWEDTDGGYTTNGGPFDRTNSDYTTALDLGIITEDEDVGAYRSQMLNSYCGKILRINKDDGKGISSNPFYDPSNPDSPQSKVWALGFRNPYRMSLRPGAGSTNPLAADIGEVYLGDVGLGAWEEFNIVKSPGTNFGWPIFEGTPPSSADGTAYWGVETRSRGQLYNTDCPASPEPVAYELLVKQDNAALNSDIVINYCGERHIASGIRYLHRRPALAWARNPGMTRVARYDENGNAIDPTIGTPESGVSGSTFTGNAAIGGLWYTGRGNSFPSDYNDTYLLADYGGLWIKRVKIEYTDQVTAVDDLITNAGAVVGMAENPIDGTVVYITYDHPQVAAGKDGVHKLVYGGNIPPTAEISLSPGNANNYSSSPSLTLNFRGDESFDPTPAPNGGIALYDWDFGDGTSSTEMNPTHTFTAPDNNPIMYVVKLKVTDIEDGEAEKEFIVSLNNLPPTANITNPANGTTYRVADDTTYQLIADVTDDHLTASELTYAWQATLVHNNHTHPGPLDPNQSPGAIINRVGCTDTYSWRITLTVTDNAGLVARDTVKLLPQCSGALPIMLHKFSVTQNNPVNVVKWSTELEANIEYFEVERSSDGVNFETINRQDARNTPGTNHYSYSDRDFPPGYNYYRLKIVEHGEIIRYSVIVRTVADAENLELKVVPNPVRGNFSIVYKSLKDDRVTVNIMDMSGRVIHKLSENVNRGQNVIYLQNLPSWASGVYFITVQNKDEVKRAKFVKTR